MGPIELQVYTVCRLSTGGQNSPSFVLLCLMLCLEASSFSDSKGNIGSHSTGGQLEGAAVFPRDKRQLYGMPSDLTYGDNLTQAVFVDFRYTATFNLT